MHFNLYQVAIILLVVPPVAAQEALGRGDALDSSTSVLGKVNSPNTLPSGVRNNEIRGSNVMYGRGFNEGIGRSSNSEMWLIQDAANSGEEEYLDALNNSPWYWNNWNQQSAQFLIQGDRSYFNPRFVDEWSTSPQQMHTGRSIRTYSHGWDEESAKKYAGESDLEYPDEWSNRQVEQFRLGQVLGSGYQTPSADTSPLPVGSYQSQNTIGYLAASPLSGVSLETSLHPTSVLGLTAWDAARAYEDTQAGIAPNSLVNAWRTQENRLDYTSHQNRVSVPDQYNNLLETIANRAIEVVEDQTSETVSKDWLDNQYSLLQHKLLGMELEKKIEEEDEPTIETKDVEEEAIKVIAAALRHGERISHFGSKYQTRFDELVQQGEEQLATGAYFLSGQRFNHALRLIPGHPLATAGLGHANIGAGLYLSAGHVLQSLLSFQPEMIDVMYDPQLLPTRIDLVRSAVTIGLRLDEKRDGATYAFLLAYIGHQLNDLDMVQRGLNVLEASTDKHDPLVPLLKSIWLGTSTNEPQESQEE